MQETIYRARRARRVVLLITLALALLAPLAAARPAAEQPAPERDRQVESLVRDAGLVCTAPSVRDRCGVRAEEDGVRLWQGDAAVVLRFAPPFDESCVGTPGSVAVCPAPDRAAVLATPADAAGAGDPAADPAADPRFRQLVFHLHVTERLQQDLDLSSRLASAWHGRPHHFDPRLHRVSRTLDVLLVVWFVLLLPALAVALRRRDRTDRLLAGAALLAAVLARLVVPAGVSNFYYAVPFGGPHPGVYTGLYTAAFDSFYRWAAALPNPSVDWVFGAHITLGALMAPLVLLGARQAGAGRGMSLAWAMLIAGSPALVWVARSDAHHALPIGMFAAAFFGLTLPRRRLGTLLALLSFVLGALPRVETTPGLLAAVLLPVAMSRAPRRDLPRMIRLGVAGGVLVAVAFGLTYGEELFLLGSVHGGFGPAAVALAFGRSTFASDPMLPLWAWAILVAAMLGGAAVCVRRRRMLPLLAVVAGLLVAGAPAWLTGRADIESINNYRYVILTLPYALWLAAVGIDAAADRLRGLAPRPALRRAASALLVAPALLFLLAALPRLTTFWGATAEFQFLDRNLSLLPPDCHVTGVFAGSTSGWLPGVPRQPSNAALALPHPLLALRHPALRWHVVVPGMPPPEPRGKCHAVYMGTPCALTYREMFDAGFRTRSLAADSQPTCAALEQQLAGAPIAEATYPLPEDGYLWQPNFQSLTLRLFRVR